MATQNMNKIDVVNTFITQFGNTPGGVTQPRYGAGTTYTDRSNSSQAKSQPQNNHTAGEKSSTNLVKTYYISVVNKPLDELPSGGGVMWVCYSPKSINYETTQKGLNDPRAYQKIDCPDLQFLTYNKTKNSLIPLQTSTTTTSSLGASTTRGTTGY
tara:strand:- start:455 stop:922 length:468 start_codon:yes stop_codon:yes gene_type:complete